MGINTAVILCIFLTVTCAVALPQHAVNQFGGSLASQAGNALGSLWVHGNNQFGVKLYDDTNFRGGVVTVTFGSNVGCFDIRSSYYPYSSFNDVTSSVNSGGHCVDLFEHGNCRGASLRISPSTESHNNLGAIAHPNGGTWNDRVSSLRAC